MEIALKKLTFTHLCKSGYLHIWMAVTLVIISLGLSPVSPVSAALYPVQPEIQELNYAAVLAACIQDEQPGVSIFDPDVLIGEKPSASLIADLDCISSGQSRMVNGPTTGKGLFQSGTPSIYISDVTMDEGDSGSTYFDFLVTLSGYTASNVTFQASISGGSADSSSDYYSLSTSYFTIYSGDLSTYVSVRVRGDPYYENDETFYVSIYSITGATAGDTSATGTITNDDIMPSMSINNGDRFTEYGVHAFEVCLSKSVAIGTSAHYATANGTTNASDFVATSGTITFYPGDYCKYISVTVNEDTLYEDSETYYVNLSSPNNATLDDSQGVGTVRNNDSPPDLSISDRFITEGSSSTLTVYLASASGLEATFDYES